MNDEKRFFIRDPWKFDPDFKRPEQPGDGLGFDTQALHAGFRPTENLERFRSFVPPIIPSMTYPYECFDKIPYPVYGRTKTPTADILEQRLAALEGGQAAVSAGSGSQALFNLIFTIARPGDNIVTSLNIFGEGYKQASLNAAVSYSVLYKTQPTQNLGTRKSTVIRVWFGWRRPATRFCL